jgi:hypothetical protein
MVRWVPHYGVGLAQWGSLAEGRGMTIDQSVEQAASHEWYMRPVLFVSDVQRALGFYVGTLGFEKKWHEADGKDEVCQVDCGGCEIILCEDATRDERAGSSSSYRARASISCFGKPPSVPSRHRSPGGGTTCSESRTRMATSFSSASNGEAAPAASLQLHATSARVRGAQ